jgi:hypothetical protein
MPLLKIIEMITITSIFKRDLSHLVPLEEINILLTILLIRNETYIRRMFFFISSFKFHTILHLYT